MDVWHLDDGDDVAALLKGVDWRERTLRTLTPSCASYRAFAINRFDAGQCDWAVHASSWTDVESAGMFTC